MELIKRSIKYYGWKPDIPDFRDFKYKLVKPRGVLQSVNLAEDNKMPLVFDQGSLGSCTANAISSLLTFDALNKHRINTKIGNLLFSRLFIYYNERVLENSIDNDAGAELRDGLKSVATVGVCSENAWKYDINKFTLEPKPYCYEDALKYKALTYERIDSTNRYSLVDCLVEGYPFVFGFSVYDSFESDTVIKTGVVPMPQTTDRLLGGHAVMAYAYNVTTDLFTCRNSWGRYWGVKGDFYLPAAYIIDSNLASDFWTIKSIL